MKARGIFAILGAFVAMVGGIVQRKEHHTIPGGGRSRRTGGRGRGTGHAGGKLWHRLTTGHSNSAAMLGRKARKYARRGYGYIAPIIKKVEAVA